MGQAYQAYSKSHADGQLPLIGIFHCMYCGRRFSIKRHLNLHYRQEHPQVIPTYEK